MNDPRRTWRCALIALLALAALALVATGAAADEQYDDWTVRGHEERENETIMVTGTLTVELGGSLTLTDCEVRFTRGVPGAPRVNLTSGHMTLVRTRIIAEGSGQMIVDGHLDIQGASTIEQMDVLVRDLGFLNVKGSQLVLRGRYTSSSVNDPVTVHVEGSCTIVDSTLTLEYGFLSSEGTISIARSTVEASLDFGRPYAGHGERLRFDGGVASLVDSSFNSLYLGIHSRADLSARDCVFQEADLTVYAPWWHSELRAWVDGCTLTDSDLRVALEDSDRETKQVHVVVEDTVLDQGVVVMDLDEAYEGTVRFEGVEVSGYTGYGVTIRANGIDGELVLESMDLSGPWGIQALYDYSGLQVLNSTIDAEQTALDFVGLYSSVPAYVDQVTTAADVGIKARNTRIGVTGSDLSATGTPLLVEESAALTLTDCMLDVDDIDLRLDPGDRPASVRVDRHLDIGSTRWSIGDPIEEGMVTILIHSETTLFPVPKTWTVGSADLPIIRLLEWVKDGDTIDERTIYVDLELSLQFQGATFGPEDDFEIDPWDEGPFELVFADRVQPWLQVSGDVDMVINSPDWVAHGTTGDVGTGLEGVGWALYTPMGELVDSGEVDYLTGGRWKTTITMTGDMMVVQFMPRDRSGNHDVVPTQGIHVAVPTPLLTVIEPESGRLSNRELVTISGTADFYADHVEVQVLGLTGTVTIPVTAGHFSQVFRLTQQGLNDLVISAHDPFGGFDEKRVQVILDTVAPEVMLEDLRIGTINNVNNPSLVIAGSTDDPRATIVVMGQDVGLVERHFATTVPLVEGVQTIRVKATDVAGNENVVNLHVDLDTIAPILELVSPASNPFWSTRADVEVVVAVDEALSSATVNGETIPVVDGRITHGTTLGSTSREVAFRVADLAGNVAELRVVLRLDTDVPTLNLVSPKDGQVVNSTAVPIVVATSEVGCRLTVDGVAIDTEERANGRLVGIMYLPQGEGERTVTLTIIDRAGNSRSADLTLDVDTVFPTIRVDDFHDGMRVTTEPLRIVGWTEPGSKVVYVNDRMAALSPDGKFTTTIELVEGWQEVRFVVIDRAGNRGDVSYEVKALGQPSFDPPVAALAAGTILVTLGALAVTTEAGRWSMMALVIPLYTKLRKDKILDQRTRGLIEGYITANPGANYTIIRDNLDLADGTLTYHLQVLEREGFVYSIREGLFRCFYPQGVPPPKRGKLHLSDTQADIVRIAKRIPGITVGEIATAMNRRPNVISYHLKLLRDGGLIRMEEDGRHVRVYPIDSAVAMI